YNTDSSTGNATANAIVDYLMNDQIVYYDDDLNLVNDTSYITQEKVNDDPLQVKYTINDDATWLLRVMTLLSPRRAGGSGSLDCTMGGAEAHYRAGGDPFHASP